MDCWLLLAIGLNMTASRLGWRAVLTMRVGLLLVILVIVTMMATRARRTGVANRLRLTVLMRTCVRLSLLLSNTWLPLRLWLLELLIL